ncbi:MAG: DEAD/DEAH box helicase [Saprospiraceae bacterium]|nr:DEAD/DEAH box helicase [Saprospiraceae bacterium]
MKITKKDAFTDKPNQMKLIWITPIKALAKEILISSEKALQALGLPWNAEIRTGDSTAKDRATQFKSPPEILITTPESLHVIFPPRL